MSAALGTSGNPSPAAGQEASRSVAGSRPSAGEVIREVARELAERASAGGDRALAERLGAELARPESPETTLVVVGETKRGKSSLVNALVGTPGLSPVDEDIATSVHLVIRHAESRVVRVHHDGGAEDVAPESLVDWATERGGRLRASGVSAVEIGLDHPLLERGLTVIDTPGVGGLAAAHREVTLAALVRADALLFVLDPDAPISGPEREFLRQVTERLGTVLFALTKVDLYAEWETILEADREILDELDRERAGAGAPARRFSTSPFIPVSNVLKEEADELRAAGDDEAARELLADSGFAELESALQSRVVGRARALRLLNLSSLCRSALASLELPERVDSAAGDPALEAELEAAAARQDEFRRSEKSWPVNLTAELETLRVELDAQYERSIATLTRDYEERLVADGAGADEWLQAALEEDLRALAARLDGWLQEGVADIVGRLLDEFGIERVVERELGVPLGDADVRLPALASVATGAEGITRAQRVMEYGRGGSLGAALGARLLDLAIPGLGLVIGTGAGLLFGRLNISLTKGRTERLGDRQQALKFVQRAVGPVARTEIRAPLQARMAAVRRDVNQEIRAHVEQRAAELQDALARQRRLMQEDQSARQRRAQEADRRLKELDALRGRLDAAERVLGSARAPQLTSRGRS